MSTVIQIKRAYEAAAPDDGYRIYIDRLWPRGISKEHAHFDEWEKEISPSNELRKWFNHEPAKFPEFQKKFKAEIEANEAMAGFIEKVKQHPKVTLLFSAKDTEHNNAVVMLAYLKDHLAR